HLARGRPVVALVAERFGAQHYIVILGIDGDRVFWHDPARGPERSGTVAAVERRWREAGGWGLLVLPPALVTDRPPQAAESPLEIPPPCRGWIDVGIGLARAGEMNAARMALD